MNQLPDPQSVLDLAEYRRSDLRRSFSRPKPGEAEPARDSRIMRFPPPRREPISMIAARLTPGA